LRPVVPDVLVHSLANNCLITGRLALRNALFFNSRQKVTPVFVSREPDLGEEIFVAVVMKYQPFVISNLVALDWHGKGYLLNISILTAKSQRLLVEQGLDDVIPGLEFPIPDNKIEWYGYVDPSGILRVGWHRRKGKIQSEKKSDNVFCEALHVFSFSKKSIQFPC
jgi:hypothetical protein